MKFRPSARIRTSTDFQRTQTRGKRFVGRQLILVHCKNPEEGPRLGIVVSKKTGNAVVRNRWKRVIRETFRLKQAELEAHTDHVIIVRSTTKGAPDATSLVELKELFAKVQKC